MNAPLVQRQAALAAVALLATIGALALGEQDDEQNSPSAESAAPTIVPRWEDALAAPYGPAVYGETTACGIELTPSTRGVAHPVLPCGVDLVIAYGGLEVRAEVIDRGPFEPGRQFDLTEALAHELGIRRAERIRWRFAG